MWKKLLFFLLLFPGALYGAVNDSGLTIRFPGSISETISPNKKYVLYNVDPEKQGANEHFLFLKNLKEKKYEKLYSYSRYVDVLWSP